LHLLDPSMEFVDGDLRDRVFYPQAGELSSIVKAFVMNFE